MTAQVLDQISWPFVVLAAFVLLCIVTWPPYRRLAREVNLTFAAGDVAASLRAMMKLHRSRLPLAVLQRLLNRGYGEALIASRLYLLGRPSEALDWCRRGLRIARRPPAKALLHDCAASAHAHAGNAEQCDQHLLKLGEVLKARPAVETTWLISALLCKTQLGQLDVAGRLVDEVLKQRPGPISRLQLMTMVTALHVLGRHRDTLALSAWMLQTSPTTAPMSGDAGLEGSVGTRQATSHVWQSIDLGIASIAIGSAREAERWDLFERYLGILEEPAQVSPHFQINRLGYRAIYRMHDGKRIDVAECESAIRELIEAHPDDQRVQSNGWSVAAAVWRRAGNHERALAALRNVNCESLSPIDRSQVAAFTAQSLEALGQAELAAARREEARRLAPLAFWNQPAGVQAESESGAATEPSQGEFPGSQITVNLQPAPRGDQPIERVVSRLGPAAWILAIFSLIPLVGGLLAIALLVVSIVILAGRRPLLHDRRVGLAGLIIALFSIGCSTLIIVNQMRIHGPPHPRPKTAVAPTEESEEEVEAEPWPGTASAPDEEDRGEYDAATDEDAEPEAVRPGSPSEWRIPLGYQVLIFAVLIISIIFHEIGHAVSAFWSGDPTARDRGRFSLNPARHVDLVGSIIVPIVLSLLPGGAVIGWAKPVPVNPQRFRCHRRGTLAVSLAGVSVNFMLALAAANILIVLLIILGWLHPEVRNAWVAVTPLVPIRLPGVPEGWAWAAGIEICKTMIVINIMLANFNLLPFPPLDGFGVVRGLFPNSLSSVLNKLAGAGMIVVLLVIAFNAVGPLLRPGLQLAARLLIYSADFAGWPF